jgi:hypothetical protein
MRDVQGKVAFVTGGGSGIALGLTGKPVRAFDYITRGFSHLPTRIL